MLDNECHLLFNSDKWLVLINHCLQCCLRHDFGFRQNFCQKKITTRCENIKKILFPQKKSSFIGFEPEFSTKLPKKIISKFAMWKCWLSLGYTDALAEKLDWNPAALNISKYQFSSMTDYSEYISKYIFSIWNTNLAVWPTVPWGARRELSDYYRDAYLIRNSHGMWGTNKTDW